ncbi:MAG: hypothetical protein ACEQSB_06210 [Undibacterium sp.]
MNQFPAWHDGKAWMQIMEELKSAAGAHQVSISFDMPHGWAEYKTPDED